MRSRRTRQLQAILLGATVFAGSWCSKSGADDAGTQTAAQAADSAAKELEPAASKIREGRIDEALGLIKEMAAKHPDWSPSQLILARLLFSANQALFGPTLSGAGRRPWPDHPDVYLTFGQLALGEGRVSDARLNFENALALAAAGHWSAEKTRTMRCESLSGLAAVSEAREDWKATRERLNACLALDPKQGKARQRLARAPVSARQTRGRVRGPDPSRQGRAGA